MIEKNPRAFRDDPRFQASSVYNSPNLFLADFNKARPFMQTVNFNCPHCGNLMAVGTNLLARNVRCPHCKQVVRAPAAAGEPPLQAPVPTPAPPPITPMFNVPKPTEHHESIFGEVHDEDLFGTEHAKPTVPPERPQSPPVQMDETVQMPLPQPVYVPPPGPTSPTADTLTFEGSNLPGSDFSSLPNQVPERRFSERTPPSEERPVYRGRPIREEAAGTPAFAWILLAYSAVITIAAGFFAYQYFAGDAKSEHPYKAMPDVLRQYDPAKKTQVSFNGLPDPKLDIPDNLRVKLGDEITVGDLLVQPKSIEKQKLVATTKYVSEPDKSRRVGESLVMTMRVKNLSNDTTFYPNDPAFQRAIDTNQALTPYTALQIHRTFYYGTFRWPPDTGVTEEFFEGQETDREPLKPGAERETWITAAPAGVRTSGSLNLLRTLDDQKPEQAMLWRVQLRRGLMKMKSDASQDIDVSTTCVIGVEFKKDQIKQ